MWTLLISNKKSPAPLVTARQGVMTAEFFREALLLGRKEISGTQVLSAQNILYATVAFSDLSSVTMAYLWPPHPLQPVRSLLVGRAATRAQV